MRKSTLLETLQDWQDDNQDRLFLKVGKWCMGFLYVMILIGSFIALIW